MTVFLDPWIVFLAKGRIFSSSAWINFFFLACIGFLFFVDEVNGVHSAKFAFSQISCSRLFYGINRKLPQQMSSFTLEKRTINVPQPARRRPLLNLHALNPSEAPFPPVTGPITITKVSVRAPPQLCLEIASDFEKYMEWSRGNGMKSVRVLERDARGRGVLVEFTAGTFGFDVRNVVAYRYPTDGASLEFRISSGDVIQRLEGRYTFTPAGPGITAMSYELGIGFAFNLPDFAREQIGGAIARTALEELRQYIENQARRIQIMRRFSRSGGDAGASGSGPSK
jgi:hypothetical protein